MIAKTVIDKAEQYFTMLKGKCNYSDPASRQMAMIYQLSVEGIKIMRQDSSDTIKEDKS
jgi:lipopolysaccharide biosynthesis regulator YciM